MNQLTLVCALMLTSVLAMDPFNCSITDENCEVPYQSSMLVLYCPEAVEWQHSISVFDEKAGHYLNRNVTICSDIRSINRTCIVRGYKERLSNGDSGPYYCVKSARAIWRVNVTILAPPKIGFNDHGTCTPPGQRNSCETSTVLYRKDSFNLTTEYTSIAPVTVRWFLNETDLDCPTSTIDPIHHHCTGVYTTSKYSTIKLDPDSDEDYSLNGRYRAEISNVYGSNSTVTVVSQNCTKRPKDITNDDVYFTVIAGEPLPVNLTRACRDGAELDIPRFLCFTNNPNVTFEQSLANFSECAICGDTDLNLNRGCQHPFGNNDHFLVRATTETCPSILNLSIQSKENTTVDFSDSGRIFCAYQHNVYTTVHIRVIAKPPPNLLSLEIAAPASAAVLLMIVTLLVVISALGYKHRALLRARSGRSRRRQRAEVQRLLVEEKGDAQVSTIVSSKQRRAYRTFTTDSSDSDLGRCTEVQSDLPGDLPAQVQGNPKEVII